MKRYDGNGISPKLMATVHRVVFMCDRCGLREQHDTVQSKFDIKNGINFWGSGGVCMGCKKNETCTSSPNKIMLGTKLAYQTLGGFMYSHCPIGEFAIIESEKHKLNEASDTLID